MNLFFSKLTGKLWSTEKLEHYLAEQEESIARYRQVENSPEMKEYLTLKKEVESKEFQQKKYNLTHTKYKSTKYFTTMKEFKVLKRNRALQLYLQVKDSAQLREYLEFRQSPEYVKIKDKKEVKQSPLLQSMLRFENSKAHQAYVTFRNSALPQRYAELLDLIGSADFREEKAFWQNPRRWHTTEGHIREVRLAELAASPDIRFFLKTSAKRVEEMENYIRVFADEFDWVKMTDSCWKPGFAYKSKQLKSVHSFANEQQANNGGRNVGNINGCLTILTQREQTTAPAWDPKKGFINKDFEYTSDIIQTASAFRQKEGLFMVKLRCEGNIHHAYWLGSTEKLPLVSIFHYTGKHVTLGNYGAKGFDGTQVDGINPRAYYIYSLRWTKREMIWYVNNIEVFRTTRDLPQEPLYMAASSFISLAQRAQEGKLEVDWVRVYAPKKD